MSVNMKMKINIYMYEVVHRYAIFILKYPTAADMTAQSRHCMLWNLLAANYQQTVV